MVAPNIEIVMRVVENGVIIYWNMEVSRMRPYPPNLRRILASSMEPAVGASTCAFGNHRCREYIGIFTKKATMHMVHHRFRLMFVGGAWAIKNMLSCIDSLSIRRILSRRGRLAETVYIII